MSTFRARLRDGGWLTPERIRLWSAALLFATVAAACFVLATSDGLNDFKGRPLGTDFANVYAAGTYVLEGQAAAPFDPARQFAREQAIFGPETQFYGWHYPPFFLFVAGALALLPYGAALLIWQGTTLVLYLGSVGAIWRRLGPAASPNGVGGAPARNRAFFTGPWLVPALGFPAVLVNLGHGHNGFLTAALIGAALATLDVRPLLSGILFGLLAYKPQFGLLVPLALVAGGHWRATAAAGMTVVVLIAAATVAFGPEVWAAFSTSMGFTRTVVLEAGETGWHKIQSLFSWVRMWGGSVGLAYALQATAIVGLAGSLILIWKRSRSRELCAAALPLAALLATPYSLDYDLMALAPAIAFMVVDGVRRGFLPYEKTALAALWAMPLIARSVAGSVMIPLGVPAMVVCFVLLLRRASVTKQAVPLAMHPAVG